MIDPYRMVFVNVITSLLVLAGTIIYRYIYPKKKINLFILLLIISILPIISIFRAGTYESGAFDIHVRRTMEFYSLLSQGNLMPTWAADLNATYGYPLFAFNYTLPYYIISLFHFFNFSFIDSLKLFLASNFVFSGIFMYLFSKNFFKNSLTAFCASIFYLFTPYHLISLHFKVTIGEILAYTFIPLVFYFLNKFLTDKKSINLLFAGFSLGLTMLSHIFVGIFLIPTIPLYIILETKKISKGLFYSFGIVAVSLLISAYQWAAPLIYRPYMFTTAYPTDPINNFYFPEIIDLLYSPWRYGLLFQGPKGELSFLLGYAQILVVFIIIALLMKNKIRKKYRNKVVFWIVLFIFTLFLITPYSISIWRYLPIVNLAGSQRLLIIIAFYTSILAGYISFIYLKKNWVIYVLILFAIGTTILNWGQRRVIPAIDDSVLRQNLAIGIKWGDEHFYALPRWVDPKELWFSKIPDSHLEILNGKGTVKNLSRTSIDHQYLVDAKTSVNIKENTLYFPGWSLKSNRKFIPVQTDKRGVITATLPTGLQKIELKYEDLFLFKLAKIVSAVSILTILFIGLVYMLRHYLISQRRR
ncbi:MAG: 6-pyruvoyl-tetrahydropterin synthase-related protein [Patescibacteria group bacterium]|nr:6-pyruvoyl-tetrahydropterin synthase-related protein [Patescibacteria group bacterium]